MMTRFKVKKHEPFLNSCNSCLLRDWEECQRKRKRVSCARYKDKYEICLFGELLPDGWIRVW